MLPVTPEPPIVLSFLGLAVYAAMAYAGYQVLFHWFPILVAWFGS